jgi:hypothetical protein
MLIREESFLLARDIRIHEAAHFGVGILLGLPMGEPEVFRDGSGGRVNLGWTEIHASVAAIEGQAISQNTEWAAARRVATMYLAGFAGECIITGADTSEIVGGHSHDLAKACEVLELVGAPVDQSLKRAWAHALEILKACWPAVTELAGMIPETDGGHRPPQFH